MSGQLIEKAPAKVNLSLGVLGRQADGYHLLDMVNHSIDLYDELILTPSDSFEFIVSDKRLENRHNLVFRVIEVFSHILNRTPDFRVELIKRIPEQAGLAGGSSDAAAMIRLIRKHWDLDVSSSQLRQLGLKIGADVPFCLGGGTAYVTGIGERIYPLKDFKPGAVLIVDPGVQIKTPQAYRLLDQMQTLEVPDTMAVIRAIETNNYSDLKRVAKNSFLKPLSTENPQITKIIEDLYSNDAFYATMSGSGSAIAGFFDDKQLRDKAAESLSNYKTFRV